MVPGADGFGMMGAVAGVAFLDVDGVKRGSYGDGV